MPRSPRMLPLPRGLNPVIAGRIGIWLLSRRSHRAAQKRVAFPYREKPAETLVLRFVRLVVPWTVYQYPGAQRYLAALLGIRSDYANSLMKPSWGAKLPQCHALRLAQFLEAHGSQALALAAELRQAAQKRPRGRPPRGLVK